MIPISRLLRMNASQRRSVTSTLFGLTFFAALVTVAFPCPATERNIRGLPKEHDVSSEDMFRRSNKRKWIEEVHR
ncbi:hypothetical protein DACRYDRAFT_24965 [Dacryopinax primogenitus]|uniref:Uncharacterized protein n=1 Tax=Dacryopinax primogenitus (strain DJM 731) TaxID=1858805 RepID=M5FRH1_DACPD|nr:uncharacterized protein DACRYDRAFT_24965 [Dacryopinax primogenitus]EJT97584.1 hypothetical protein DACRYDRAFT_24965 [Dacryopinax primogenitus]